MNNTATGEIKKKCLTPAAAAALAMAAAFFFMPSDASQGCADGIQLCLNVAVPSLFPMMFATIMATETGITQWLGRLLSPVARTLFGISGNAGGAVIMAITGGFPAGAKAVSGLYERGEIGREEGERMCLFCFAAGPAFLIGAVGGMYGSVKTGVSMLVIQVLSVILVGMISRVMYPDIGRNSSKERAEKQPVRVSTAQAMTDAVSQTAAAMLNICLYIILFSIFRAVLDASGISGGVAAILAGLGISKSVSEAVLPLLLEVTSGCAAAAESGLPTTAFAVGFGGLAVHMQVLSIAKSVEIRYGRFFLARLIQGVLCAAMMQVYILVTPENTVAAFAGADHTASISSTPTGAVLLVVMSAMYLICLPQMDNKKLHPRHC